MMQSADPSWNFKDGLTPIRIRGKRYRKGDKPPKKGTSELRSIRQQSDHPTGDPSEDSTQIDKRVEPSRPKERRLAKIEQLPAEILEQIFTECLELNLPAASLHLCRSISTFDIVKKRLFLTAFAPNEASPSPLPAPFSRDVLLRLRWMTYGFLEQHLGPDISDVKQKFEIDLVKVPRRWMPQHSGWAITAPQNEPPLSVPSKLLHAPWNIDKGLFLDILLSIGAKIDREDSIDEELGSQGLLDAIRTDDYECVRVLVRQSRFRRKNGCVINYPDEGIAPERKHLRAAVLETGCDEHMVRLIMNSDVDPVMLGDRAIWQWIHARKEEGDERGRWLEQMFQSKRNQMSVVASIEPSLLNSVGSHHYQQRLN